MRKALLGPLLSGSNLTNKQWNIYLAKTGFRLAQSMLRNLAARQYSICYSSFYMETEG